MANHPLFLSTTKLQLGLGLALVILLALSLSVAYAATITVAASEVDINDNDVCSLLEALENANDTSTGAVHDDCVSGDPSSSRDTIELTDSTYSLTASQVSSLGPSGLLITSKITINGNGATITRNSGGNYRLFYVSSAGNFTLKDVTLDNGLAKGGNGGNGATGSGSGFGGGGGGGGLGGNGANGTAVSNCTSKSKGGGGGGEQGAGSGTTGGASTGGDGSTGSGGSDGGLGGGGGGGGQSGGCAGRSPGAGGFGGGGGGGGNPTSGGDGGFGAGGGGAGVHNSTTSQTGGSGGEFGSDGANKTGSNRAGGGGGGAPGLGGAMMIDGGTVIIRQSTFTSNQAKGGNGGSSNAGRGGRGAGLGGAIFMLDGDLTVENSTFTDNDASQGSSGNGTASGHGAAIFIYDGTATLDYNTFSDNSNDTGGTIYLWDDASVSGVLNMTGNIIANTDGGEDCIATSLSTNSVNLIEDDTCSPAMDGDPLLSDLGDYGGHTQTMGLLPGSIAIDAATASCESTDQRQVSRPQNSLCDIGAFESQGFNISITGGDDQTTVRNTDFAKKLEVTFAANDTSEPIGSDVAINFTAPGSGASLSTTSFTDTINASGVVSATVTANNTVGSYNVTAEASVIGSSVAFSLTNRLADTAPVFNALSDQTVTEVDTLAFTLSATDVNGGALTYGIDDPTSGMILNSSTGSFSWTPTEGQGPGTYVTQFIVTDTTNLTDEMTITITVEEDDQAPEFSMMTDQAVTETNLFTMTISATDDDIPANDLTFGMSDAPTGATLDSDSGLFSWTPTETQGPGTYAIKFVVTDTTDLTDEMTVSIIVSEDNQAPVLTELSDQAVGETNLFTMTLSAMDDDLPANDLTYSMTGEPTGASLDEDSGLLSWTPETDQGPGEYPITFTVEDDGSPNLSDSQTITITVFDRLPTLAITKTVELVNDPAIPGDIITYTITVANSGGQADDVMVQDTLPDGVEGDDLDWTGSIAENSSEIFTIVATVTTEAGYGATISNTASFNHVVGSDSDTTSFTTIADTTAPDVSSLTLSAPVGTITNQRPIFDWNQATDTQSGVASYTLQLNDGSTVQEFSVTSTSYTPAADLQIGVYTWTVKAEDAVGNASDYVSPEAMFEIKENAMSIYLPLVVKE